MCFFPPKFVIVTIIIVGFSVDSLWILVFRPTLRSFIVTENISWSCVVFPAFLSFLTHVIIMAASPCVVLVENAVFVQKSEACTHTCIPGSRCVGRMCVRIIFCCGLNPILPS